MPSADTFTSACFPNGRKGITPPPRTPAALLCPFLNIFGFRLSCGLNEVTAQRPTLPVTFQRLPYDGIPKDNGGFPVLWSAGALLPLLPHHPQAATLFWTCSNVQARSATKPYCHFCQ